MPYIIGTRTFGAERYLQGRVWTSFRQLADRFNSTTEIREALGKAENPTAARQAYLIDLDKPEPATPKAEDSSKSS
jgi:hypothetical protein